MKGNGGPAMTKTERAVVDAAMRYCKACREYWAEEDDAPSDKSEALGRAFMTRHNELLTAYDAASTPNEDVEDPFDGETFEER